MSLVLIKSPIWGLSILQETAIVNGLSSWGRELVLVSGIEMLTFRVAPLSVWDWYNEGGMRKVLAVKEMTDQNVKHTISQQGGQVKLLSR